MKQVQVRFRREIDLILYTILILRELFVLYLYVGDFNSIFFLKKLNIIMKKKTKLSLGFSIYYMRDITCQRNKKKNHQWPLLLPNN